MKHNRQHILLYSILYGLLIIVYAAGLFIDVTRDGAKYAYIAKEMIFTGNWIDIHILGEPYEQKPHLMFWLSALSFKILGISNFAYKIPVLLFSLLGVFFTYKLGCSAYNKKTGKIAAIMTLSTVLFVLYNMDLHTDTLLFTTTALALWQLFEYLKTRRMTKLLFASFALGLALLTKGPFGVILPLFCVTAYFASKNKWKELLNINWYILVVLSFLVATPVFMQLYNNWGFDGIWFFFVKNTFGRFTGSYLGHTPDPFFYIHNMAYLLLPWTLVFFAALAHGFVSAYKKKQTLAESFFFWGFLVFFLVISASISKLPNYLMSLLPLIAVYSANFWLKKATQNTTFYRLQWWLNFWLLVLTAAISLHFSDGLLKLLALLPFILAALFSYSFKESEKKQKILNFSLISGVSIAIALNLVVVPMLFGHQAQPKAAKIINNANGQVAVFNYPKSSLKHIKRSGKNLDLEEDHIFNQTPDPMHFSYNYVLMFYSNHKVQQIETYEQVNNAIKTPGAFIYTDKEGKRTIYLMDAKVDTIYSFDHFSLKRTAKLIFPKKNESPFEKTYLIKISD